MSENNNFISRDEHKEFAHRIDSKIEDLSSQVSKLYNMASSIDVLARDMEHMLQEQIDQGKRIANLENEDGKKWRNLTSYIITVIVGAIVGMFLNRMGVM